jgi:hypothetical protein
MLKNETKISLFKKFFFKTIFEEIKPEQVLDN